MKDYDCTVKVINKSNNPLPSYSTENSAGMDLRAFISDGGTIVISPGQRKLISTGLCMSLPVGYEAQIRPRSGLALKNGITVLNSPGTIDADYRGDLGVILINHGDEDFKINNGDRIAQMVISRYERVGFIESEVLDDTDRGSNGFGHTGIN